MTPAALGATIASFLVALFAAYLVALIARVLKAPHGAQLIAGLVAGAATALIVADWTSWLGAVIALAFFYWRSTRVARDQQKSTT